MNNPAPTKSRLSHSRRLGSRQSVTRGMIVFGLLIFGSCDQKTPITPVIPPNSAIEPIPRAPEPATPQATSPQTTTPLETPPYQRIGGMGGSALLPVAKGMVVIGTDPITGDIGFASIATEPMTAANMGAVRADVGLVTMAGHVNGSELDAALDLLASKGIDAAAETLRQAPGSGRRLVTFFDPNAEERNVREAPISTQLEYKTWLKGKFLVAISGPGYESVVKDAQKRFESQPDLPLAARLLLALGASGTEKAFPPLRSAAICVARPTHGATTGDGPIVDLRVEYHGAPHQRLITLYDVALKSQIGARLMAIQKRMDTQSPAYKKNRDWLRRIRNGTSIRQKD